jgi:hypothetical protein
MTTNAQQFLARLEDPAFRAAFEVASTQERQNLLTKAGLLISLKEAEAIFQDVAGELSLEDLEKAAGGDAGIILPPPEPDDIP